MLSLFTVIVVLLLSLQLTLNSGWPKEYLVGGKGKSSSK